MEMTPRRRITIQNNPQPDIDDTLHSWSIIDPPCSPVVAIVLSRSSNKRELGNDSAHKGSFGKREQPIVVRRRDGESSPSSSSIPFSSSSSSSSTPTPFSSTNHSDPLTSHRRHTPFPSPQLALTHPPSIGSSVRRERSNQHKPPRRRYRRTPCVVRQLPVFARFSRRRPSVSRSFWSGGGSRSTQW
jgi:hypothetical protein